MEKQRDKVVDAAKGLCILMIVSIHTEVFGVIHTPYPFIAVPIFFLMSGFFNRTNRTFKDSIINDAMTLLLPTAIWTAITTCYMQLLKMLKGEPFDYQFDVFNPCASDGPAWFLVALFYAKALTRIFVSFRFVNGGGYFASLILAYVGMNNQLWFYIDEGLAALPLYLLGALVYPKLKQLYSPMAEKEKYVGRSVVILSAICYVCFSIWLPYYTIVPYGNQCSPYYIATMFGIAMCCPCVFWVASWLREVRVLNLLGNKTLGIMLVHAPICHTTAAVLNRVFDKGGTMWIASFLVMYVVIVIVSYYLTCWMERYVPIMLGKRTLISN